MPQYPLSFFFLFRLTALVVVVQDASTFSMRNLLLQLINHLRLCFCSFYIDVSRALRVREDISPSPVSAVAVMTRVGSLLRNRNIAAASFQCDILGSSPLKPEQVLDSLSRLAKQTYSVMISLRERMPMSPGTQTWMIHGASRRCRVQVFWKTLAVKLLIPRARIQSRS